MHYECILTPNELRRMRWNLEPIVDGDLPLGEWLVLHGGPFAEGYKTAEQVGLKEETVEPMTVATVEELDRMIVEGRGDQILLAWAQTYNSMMGVPQWVVELDMWEQAIKLIDDVVGYSDVAYWAMVAHAYKAIGGSVA